MDVNLLSQIFFAHNGAFDVPARTSLAPGRLPVRLSLLPGLPEHEVERILLLILPGHQKRAVPSLQVVQIFVGELAVPFKASGPEVYSSVLGRIGMALFDQGVYHLQHAVNLLRRLGMRGGRPYVHCLHIFFALFNIPLGNHGGIHSLLQRLFDNLVVHVRKVGDEVDLVTLVLHIAPYGVKHDHGAGVSDMDQIVDRGPADIHLYLSLLKRDEFFFSL